MNLFDTDILFHVIFGVKGYKKKGLGRNTSRHGILSASKMLSELKRLAGVKVVFIGISTGNYFILASSTSSFKLLLPGMAFCGVLGHTVRRQYMIFGKPVDMAASLMLISFDKVRSLYPIQRTKEN